MIVITGPTASGKTKLAALLAHRLGSEIISADSRQVYKGMDIGTGKDLKDYEVEGTKVPFHLIDICPAGSKYNLFEYQRDFYKAYKDIISRGINNPILCGGTGLYIESILRKYNLPDVSANQDLRDILSKLSDEELKNKLASYSPLHNTSDLDSRQRTIRAIEIADYIKNNSADIYHSDDLIDINYTIFCLNLDRELRRERISSRLYHRVFEEGMIEEIQTLLDSGIAPEDLIYYGLEYKFVTMYIIGELSKETMLKELEIAIHQFAKRQMTWFRGMERRGLKLNYIDASLSTSEQMAQMLDILNL